MHDVVAAAKSRSESMEISKARRLQARAQRMGRQRHSVRVHREDAEAKARALIAAIRSHANSDVEMDIHMSSTELFQRAVSCLSESSARANSDDTKFVGEALKLVSSLNTLLQSR